MVFNIYLTIKAYQVRKQIEKETRLSGVTSKVKALKEKQHTIKKHLKPIITLLVVMFGGSFIAFLFLLLLIPVRLLWHHENVIEYSYSNTKCPLHCVPSQPNCVWVVFQASPRADDEGPKEDVLQKQIQHSSCSSTASKDCLDVNDFDAIPL